MINDRPAPDPGNTDPEELIREIDSEELERDRAALHEHLLEATEWE